MTIIHLALLKQSASRLQIKFRLWVCWELWFVSYEKLNVFLSHCVKSVQRRSFFLVRLLLYSDQIRNLPLNTRKNSLFGHFLRSELLGYVFFVSQKNHCTKMKYSIKDFISKCDQIPRKLQIWSHLQKQSFMKTLLFCAVNFSIISKEVAWLLPYLIYTSA